MDSFRGPSVVEDLNAKLFEDLDANVVASNSCAFTVDEGEPSQTSFDAWELKLRA